MTFSVLIVPGSWHVPAHYQPLVTELGARGIKASTVLHPTCDLTTAHITDLKHPDLAGPRPSTPWPDMHADADNIYNNLVKLVEQGEEVLLVAHSYGGLPSSEALKPELTRKARKEAGKTGGVIGMLAIASFFLPVGVSTRMAMGGTPLPTTPEQPSGLHIVVDPGENLLNDLPVSERQQWIDLMRPQSWTVHETPGTNAGFLNVPCGFLKTLQDLMTPVQGQEMGISAARSMGADVTEYSVDGGHNAFIAQPKVCVDSIVEFGTKCTAGTG